MTHNIIEWLKSMGPYIIHTKQLSFHIGTYSLVERLSEKFNQNRSRCLKNLKIGKYVQDNMLSFRISQQHIGTRRPNSKFNNPVVYMFGVGHMFHWSVLKLYPNTYSWILHIIKSVYMWTINGFQISHFLFYFTWNVRQNVQYIYSIFHIIIFNNVPTII